MHKGPWCGKLPCRTGAPLEQQAYGGLRVAWVQRCGGLGPPREGGPGLRTYPWWWWGAPCRQHLGRRPVGSGSEDSLLEGP